MAENLHNIFVKNVVGRFGVIFPKIPNFQKWGSVQNSKSPFREKRWAPLGPGPVNYSQKLFCVFPERREDEISGNFIPPPGGELISGKNCKMGFAKQILSKKGWPGGQETL